MTRLVPIVLTAIMCAACSRPAPQRLVLITIDTLRADHVGAARDGIALTPQLDRFAKDAIRYSDAVANASMTVPSHASLLTGLLPFRHGALTNDQAIAKEVPTLAEALQARGFYTGAIVSSVPLSPHSGLDRGFRSYGSKFDSAELNRERQFVKTPEATTHAALGFLRRHTDMPFFLWLHYFPPHGPYMPASEYLQGLPEAAPDPAQRLPISARNFEVGTIPAYQRYRDETDPEAYRRRYAGAVREVDQHVGRVLQALRDAGMYDAATIVITSDHGESLGEHDWYFNHANLVYAEQVQIPLLLKLPGRREAGRVVTDPVEAVDLVPTLLQSLGFPGALTGDGRVVLPEALSGPAPPRFTQSHSGELAAVIDGGHKLVLRFPRELSFIQSGYPQRELFDLASDPGETKDTSGSDPATVARLEALLRAHQSAYVKRTGPPGVDEEALRALGYVQ